MQSTSPPLTPDDERALLVAARLRACRLFFTMFLRHLRIPRGKQGTMRYEMWPHLVDMARSWQDGNSEVVLKARQLGVSWLLAAFVLWNALYRPGFVTILISSGQLTSNELLDKVRRLFRLMPASLREVHAVRDSRSMAGAGIIEFSNGSVIMALPSTETSGRSFTADLVVVDEAAFHPYAEANFSSYEPTLSNNGQLIMVSTANGTQGLFHDQFVEAWYKRSGYRARFLPWWVRPDRQTKEGKPNREWLEQQRAKYKRVPQLFRAEYPESWVEAFVSLTGLVYGMDEDGVEIFLAEPHPTGNLSPDPVPWKDVQFKYAGVDWGGGDPTAVSIYGRLPSGRVHSYMSWSKRGPVTITEIASILGAWADPRDFWCILCGAEAPNSIAELVGLGFPARAGDTDRATGLGNMAWYLKSRMMTYNPETCESAIAEFPGYRWREQRDGNSKELYATSTPVDNHADHKDENRYVLMEIQAEEMARVGDQQKALEAKW